MRISLLIIILLLIQLFFPTSGQAAPSVSANNAVLIEQSTGRILYEKGAHEKQSIASITKIMTAIIAIESGKLDEKVTVSRNAVNTEGSSIYLEQGEKIKLEDLVYGLMLRSGNDSAVAIAEHVAGSVEGFAFLMNEKAKWLGMTNTNFENPHGLDSDKHFSSAYDMAILMKYAMENETFRKVTRAKSYKSENRTYSWQNKNKLLTRLYEYCTGGKTGFTKATGRTLVSTASKDGMDLIAVTLNAPDDWNDHISMFEYGFKQFDMKPLVQQGNIKFNILDFSEQTVGYYREDVLYPLSAGESDTLVTKNYILKDLEEIDGEIIGKTIFYLGKEPIMETLIYQDNQVELGKEEGFLTNTLNFLKKAVGL